MNIACVICSDVCNQTSVLFTTPCGHIFHHECLMNWIERSKTCPQCRVKCNERTIHRVYFNFANTEHITEDVATLQCKLDNLTYQSNLKDKDIKKCKENNETLTTQNRALREELLEAENTMRINKSAMHALQDQIQFLKKQGKDNLKLMEEIKALRGTIKGMDHIHTAIHGTQEEVMEIIRNENEVNALALLTATLKKTLLNTEKKTHDLDHKLRSCKNQLSDSKKEYKKLEQSYLDLKIRHSQLTRDHDEQKEYFKKKIKEQSEIIQSQKHIDDSVVQLDTSSFINSSTNRILTESPIAIPRKRKQELLDESLDIIDVSPSIPVKVRNILESDSPYLQVKSSSIGIPSLLNTRFSSKTASIKTSIFRAAPLKIENMKKLKNPVPSEMSYNGLGGHSKEDKFPEKKPHPGNTFIKRHKSTTSIPSSKFKKLAPSKNKISDFLNMSNND